MVADNGGPQGITQPKQYFEKTYTGATFPDGKPIMSGFEETEGPGFFDSKQRRWYSRTVLARIHPVGMIGKAIQDRKEF